MKILLELCSLQEYLMTRVLLLLLKPRYFSKLYILFYIYK